MKEMTVKRKVLQVKEGKTVPIEDVVVTEFPVTVKVNGTEAVTMVCSPEYIEDMVIGYLASEDIVKEYSHIEDIWHQEKEGYVHVTASRVNPYFSKFQNKRYLTSCCGMSRSGFVFVNDALTAKKMNRVRIRLSAEDCFRLMKEMQQSSDLFHSTGGVHNASLCDRKGIVLSRSDIGRHNALDKIYGYCLKNDIPVGDKVIVFSGRISSEILLKVAKIGCEMILSKSAPTELALQLAENLGITTAGFIRNGSMNIYTCPERIITD